jgi:hypothetical protein
VLGALAEESTYTVCIERAVRIGSAKEKIERQRSLIEEEDVRTDRDHFAASAVCYRIQSEHVPTWSISKLEHLAAKRVDRQSIDWRTGA